MAADTRNTQSTLSKRQRTAESFSITLLDDVQIERHWCCSRRRRNCWQYSWLFWNFTCSGRYTRRSAVCL